MNQLQSNDIVDKINEIIANLRKIYSDKTINYFNQLNQSNDARVMAFNKIHNCILCYDITWKTFVKTFSDDCKETGQYRKRELALMLLCVKEF